jgi:hypothetical protein
MNKHVPFIWRARDHTQKRPPNLAEEPNGTTVMMRRLLGVAIAAGLLLAISGTSSGARQSRHLSGTHAQASVKEDRGVVSYPSRVPAFDPRGTSAYPFGPGINFPYPDRPYGDPDKW